MPGQGATNINFKVIGLTRPGIKLTKFILPDLPKQETDALLIGSLGLINIYIYIYIYTHIDSQTSLKRQTKGPNLNGPFIEVVTLGS